MRHDSKRKSLLFRPLMHKTPWLINKKKSPLNDDGKAFCLFILLTDALELNIFFIRLMWLYLMRLLKVMTLTDLMSNNSPGPAPESKINILSLSSSSHKRRTPGKWKNEWMGGWVVEWLTEWVSEWLSEWLSEWVSEWVREWVSEWVSE